MVNPPARVKRHAANDPPTREKHETGATLAPMDLWTRAATWLGFREEPAPTTTTPIESKIAAARTERLVWTSPSQAPRIAAVFSAVGIIATALEQLSIDLEHNDQIVPATRFISKPDPDIARGDWIHQLAVSLALHGNAYLRTWRDPYGHGLVARVLDPNKVTPFEHSRTGRIHYHHDDRDYTSDEITHLRFLMLPGVLPGLGPIQAAQVELAGHVDVTRAGSEWFQNSGTPAGLLTTDQHLTQDQSNDLANRWHNTPAGRTRVMSHGLDYHPVGIKPADAQFLENRRFSKTEIMDLFGIPASLALGIENTDSGKYANVSQDWLGFVRFRLMRYVRAIENALTGLLPAGFQARFNLESLLRADAKTRYEIHKLAIDAGIYGTDYAAEIEHLPTKAISQ